MLKALCVFGTRPEAIKMAPVCRELLRHPDSIEPVVCVTAQHREMLDQVLRLFHIKPDFDLDLMEADQSLASLTSESVSALTEVLRHVQPDLVLVQGDTTTAMVAALSAFYQQMPVGHVEAGLRTGHRYSPFPEEVNRHLISVLATYHFAPTRTACEALLAEGIPDTRVFVTGNTVIDALLWAARQPPSPQAVSMLRRLGIGDDTDEEGGGSKTRPGSTSPDPRSRVILVTAHRRENFGHPLERICKALREIAIGNEDVQVVYPVHMNPRVRKPVHRLLGGHERIHLLDPLPYGAFAQLMKHSHVILTDSGGIQEEAPALGKPVLVLRTETERPEAVEAGTVRIVGSDTSRIVSETELLLNDADEYRRMAQAVSPYGDGQAAERIVTILLGQVA
jgi:UDP-N-acetylglucosamine 2-epimerase (non-hydrolysing)